MRRLAAHYGRFRSEYPEDQLLIVFDIDGTILDMRHMVRHVRCIGLDLEPPDHVEHALVRAMGGKDGLGLPALLEVPAVRALGDGGRERHVPQQLVDLVLVDGNVVGGETVEPVGAVGPVERQQPHSTPGAPSTSGRTRCSRSTRWARSTGSSSPRSCCT
jgi:hypothetical protein